MEKSKAAACLFESNTMEESECVLDLSAIEKTFAGDLEIYRRIIRMFVGKGEENIAFLKALLEADDLRRFTIEVHNVREIGRAHV